MIKQIAWNTFKNTGNINTYLELVELENVEKIMGINIEENNVEAEKQNGNIEGKGISNIRT